MKKILLTFALSALSVYGAAITWNAADSLNDTKWSNDANWAGSTKPGASDTAVFDATGGTKAPTIDVSPSVAAVRIASTYNRAWSLSGQTLTCGQGFSDDGVTGAHNYGNGITCNGASATFHVGSGVGTVTATSCALTMNGTTAMVIDDDKNITYLSLTLGASAIVTNSGTQLSGITGAGTLLTLGANSTLTINIVIVFTPTAAMTVFTIGAGVTLNGTAAISLRGATNGTITIPAMTYTGTGTITLRESAAGNTPTIALGGTLSCAGLTINRTGITNLTTFSTGNNSITCTALNIGAVANGTLTVNLGSSTITCSSLATTTSNVGITTIDASTSQWTIKGNFALGSNTVWVKTTERIVFANTAKATITSHNEAFYDVIDSATTGQIDSLADSLTCHDLTIKTGKFKFGGNNITLSGNFTWANTCVDTIFCRMTSNNWTFVGSDPTLTLQGTGARLLDSAKWVPQNNLTVVMDSNNTIHRLLPTRQAASQRYTMQASRKLSLYYNLDYSWSGQGGNLDTMKSSTPGTLARIGLASAKVDSQMYYKDIAMQSFTEYCTTGCVNGGNDSNIVFRDGIGQLYNTPATPTFTTNSPTFGPTTGGNSDTVTGTKFFAPCSVSVDGGGYIGATVIDSGSIWFALPAHAAGLVAFQIKNADMKTVSQNNAYQYIDTVGPISYATSPVVCTTGIAMSQTCTNASGTPDSFTVAPALPTGLSIDSGNGTISGTPIVATAKAGYLVTAWSIVGNATCYDTITVIASVTCSTTVLIRAPTQVCTVGTAITPMVHAWTGGTPDSIKVRTALPTGLTAHPATGTITGTPTLRSAMAGYRVVAYGCSDSSAVWDSIQVVGFPVFTTLKHPAGWIGYADTIVGARFGASGFTASLSGTAVVITKNTDDSLIWTVPTKARGTYRFIGTNLDGLKDTVNFRVLVPGIGSTYP